MLKLPGAAAFQSTLRNKSRRYPDRDDARYDDFYIYPTVTPGFGLRPGSTIFTIGSCFARNVEKVLDEVGMDVPTRRFAAPNEEAPGESNRVLNQYNPATMVQAVAAAGEAPDQRGIYSTPQGVVDTLLATGSRSVTPARAMERRGQISDLYRDGLAQAETVVVTLGLVEAWYDLEDRIYLNEAPPPPVIKAAPDRFEFHQLDVPTCLDMVSELTERLIDGGRRRMVMTVSPVPLQTTFAGGDAVVRNSYSKSVLRVVAEMITQRFEGVDYFPSYEIITTSGMRSFGEDNVHVRPLVVDRVVRHMVRLYTGE
ncbi:MAG: GSCFA domain-containing protein [Pseudomonadota bacterium]